MALVRVCLDTAASDENVSETAKLMQGLPVAASERVKLVLTPSKNLVEARAR